jgi:hypothetical protein
MRALQTEPGQWRLSFSEAEALFIINVLARVGENYREDISRMPPAQRAYWQGTIAHGDIAHQEDLKESQEVLSEARSELRSERLALVETWLREFELAEQRDPWEVDITTAERDDLVAMLNDRRLLVSLELGVTEHDMEADLSQISSEARRSGIMEIDVLGHFILVMLGPQIYRP